jgi:IS5 family transposase
MRNLTDFALRLEYERVKDLGDKLVDIGGRLNWEGFRPALEAMYKNNTECGGRPNLDVIVMFKSLFIQQLYSLSDEQLEREIADRRLRAMFSVKFPAPFPDSFTPYP